jgi:hypothetical protein
MLEGDDPDLLLRLKLRETCPTGKVLQIHAKILWLNCLGAVKGLSAHANYYRLQISPE